MESAKEVEDGCVKCFPLIPRQGKKILFILVVINVLIIWFICKKSYYSNYLSLYSSQVALNSGYKPLYNIPVFHIPLISNKDMTQYYIDVSPSTWCMIEGTNVKESKKQRKCQCLPNWFGLDCGIPASVWKTSFMQEGHNGKVEIRRRDKPRRIILSFAFEGSFDLLEINIRNSFSYVDVFLIVEITNHSRSAFNSFKAGYLSEYQNKIMPVQLNKINFYKDRPKKFSSMMIDLWKISWNRLSDFRPDDILMFSHIESVISKDILLFLKLYDGYPEPFFVTLRPSLFKFSNVLKSAYKNYSLVPLSPGGCTFQFISTMCKYSVSDFFKTLCLKSKLRQQSFEKQHWLIKKWDIGSEKFPGGWHCHFCCSSKCILKNAKNRQWIEKVNDTVFKGKHINTSVIEQLLKIQNFSTFDFMNEKFSSPDLYFAPKVVLESKKYKHLLN